jgi:BMFP domain-containing protein YqiC
MEENHHKNRIVSYFQRMSLFEKIFWATLFLLLVAYLFLVFLASAKSVKSTNDSNLSSPASRNIIQEIEIIIHSDRMRRNLENNQTILEIKKNLSDNLGKIDQKINEEVDQAFRSVYQNIDPFLDFHYSVIGEYIELGSMATGTIGKTIQEKLFGSDFSTQLQKALNAVSDEYTSRLSDHLHFISQKATIEVDGDLNGHIIEDLQKQIDQNVKIQGGKMAVLITAKLMPKIAKVASAKLAAKSSGKIAAKVAAKLGAKSAAAATGAASGALCGPLVWICSPVAAAALWFGTDAAISTADEFYNRDEFKQDIISSLELQKNDLKSRLKKLYQKSARNLSQDIQTKYRQTSTKEKKRIKIREKIGF